MPVAASLHYLIHWPTQGGYNFVSGPLADITLITAFSGALYLWLRKHNCHVHGCWRLAWHPHPVHGHPVCKKHHPDGHGVVSDLTRIRVEPVAARAENERVHQDTNQSTRSDYFKAASSASASASSL